MKKNIPIWILSVAASLILSTGLLAQEKTEVTVKIKKDGKVVTDTTYQFDDMDEAKHALEMMDKDENVYVIKGDDDMKVEIRKILEEHDGEENAKVKVIVIKKGEDADCDHDKDHDYDEDHDHDKDHDVDLDHDEEVEVKVVKKKVKK